MALSDLDVKAIYQGDNTTTNFAITAAIIQDDSNEIKVYIRDESVTPATETLQIEGANYTLTGRPDVNSQHTTVTFTTAPSATDKVVIIRALPLTQTLDASANGSFRLEEHETAYDRFVAMIQQLNEKISRSLKTSLTSSTSEVSIPDANTGKALLWDANGDLENSTTNFNDIVPDAQAAQAAAEAAKTSAEAAESNAEDWATKPEDMTVDGTSFSALHYAAKSASSAATATFVPFPDYSNDAAYESAKGLAAETGDSYYNTTSGRLRVYDGSAWIDESTVDTQYVQLEEQSSTPTAPASGFKLLYAKNDGQLYTLDSAGNEILVGAGGGGGGITYINANAETGVTDLVPYVDAAGTEPDDATGGSPNITVTEETSSPLIGSKSYKITKDAANRQGEGVSITSENIDEAYQDAVHTVEFLWKPDSTVVADELKLFVYHPTTDLVEALYFRDFLGNYTNSLPDDDSRVHRIVAEIAPRDTTYQVVAHIAGTSTTAWTGLIDNIQAGPQRLVNVPLVTEWQNYTLVINAVTTAPSTGTVQTANAEWRRVGDSMEIRYDLEQTSSGSTGSGIYLFPLPSGYQIDTDKVTASSLNVLGNVGSATVRSSGEGLNNGYVRVYNSTHLAIVAGNSATPDNSVSSTTFDLNDSAIVYSFKATVPISGWDAGATLGSTQVDQQTVIAMYEGTASSANTSFADGIDETVDFDTKIVDTHNAVTTGASWAFTSPTKGRYKVDALVGWASVSNLDRCFLALFKNGSEEVRLTDLNVSGFAYSGSTIVDLAAGDTLQIRCFQDDGTSAARSVQTSGALAPRITIASLPDFTVIGALREKNLVQTNTLSADVTSDGAISDLTFSNLTIGKWYEIRGQIYFGVNDGTSDSTIIVAHTHNSTTLYRNVIQLQNGTTTQDLLIQQVSYVFQAAATSITFVVSSGSSDSYVRGAGDRAETFLQIEERNDLRETSKF